MAETAQLRLPFDDTPRHKAEDFVAASSNEAVLSWLGREDGPVANCSQGGLHGKAMTEQPPRCNQTASDRPIHGQQRHFRRQHLARYLHHGFDRTARRPRPLGLIGRL